MIWHPLMLAAVASDAMALLFLIMAAGSAFKILTHWQPTAAHRQQLLLEARSESASLQIRWTCWLFMLASGLLLIGATNFLPDMVSGAMCGTGVLQATQGEGSRAIFLRLMGLGILLFGCVVDNINRTRPDGPLVIAGARIALIAFPVVCLAAMATFKAVLLLAPQKPVDCCAVVYDQFQTLNQARSMVGIPESVLTGTCIGFSLLMLGAGSHLKRRPQTAFRKRSWMMALIVVLWALLAGTALVRVFSAYYYGVLHHHCPWCLFLPEHGLAGFAFLSAMAVAVFEGLLAAVLPAVLKGNPSLAPRLTSRMASSGRRIIVAVIVFLILAVLPAVMWRIRFGVWIG